MWRFSLELSMRFESWSDFGGVCAHLRSEFTPFPAASPSLLLSHIITPFRFGLSCSPFTLYFVLLQKERFSSDELKIIMSKLPFCSRIHLRTWGWWNRFLCHPLQKQKCPTQVLKMIWNTGCWLLFSVSLFFKGWALYLHCLREQTGLHTKLHSSRMMNCYG